MIRSVDTWKQTTLIDRITITVRWVFIAATGLWIALVAPGNYLLIALVAVGLVVNLVAALLAMTNHHRFARLGLVFIDFVWAHLLYALAGRPISLIWLVLLPLINAALLYRWVGAGLGALLNGIAVGGQEFLLAHKMLPTAGIGLLIAGMIVGLPLAFLAQRQGGTSLRRNGREPKEMDRSGSDRRKSIYDLISALNSTLNYQKVLETSMELSANTLRDLNAPLVEQMVSAVLLFTATNRATPELQVVSSRNMIASERDITVPGVEGLAALVVDEGTSQLNTHLSQDPELSRLSSFRSCKAAYGVPLRTGLDAYGLLLYAHPEPAFFTPDRCEVLDIVGKQSVVAIQNARLYQDLEQEKNRLLEVQEESRKKLARDLHDGPTQSISAIAMRVNFARRLMERDQKAASEELFKIEEMARRTTKEIRHMLFTLRPLVLESEGLIAALDSMADKMKETFSQEVIIQADPRVLDVMEQNKQAVVFYIAEEAVNNARKHAQAPHIWVRIKMLRDGLVLLEVEDDGVGFDVESIGAGYERRGSLGMINLHERTALVSGVLRIDSAKGRGSRVQVVIPLTEEAAQRIRSGS